MSAAPPSTAESPTSASEASASEVSSTSSTSSTASISPSPNATRSTSAPLPTSPSKTQPPARHRARRKRAMPRAVFHGRDILGDPSQSTSREFLLTSGLGGYASLSLAGTLTRSYHGLLIAAMRPPLDRTLLLSALDEVVTYLGESHCLAPHGFAPIDTEGARLAAAALAEGRDGELQAVFAANGRSGSVNAAVTAATVYEARAARHEALSFAARASFGRRSPNVSPRTPPPGAAKNALGAAALLESFRLEGTVPVFTYAVGDALLEKRIWLKRGTNAVFVRYKLMRASRPLSLSIHAIANHRDHHGRTHAARPGFKHTVSAPAPRTVVVDFSPSDPVRASHPPTSLVLRTTRGRVDPANFWVSGGVLERERERGLPDTDDHIHAASIWVDLPPGASVTVVAAALDGSVDEASSDSAEGERSCESFDVDSTGDGGEGSVDSVDGVLRGFPSYIADIQPDEEMEEIRVHEAGLLDLFDEATEEHFRQRAMRRSREIRRMSSSLSVRSDSTCSDSVRSPPVLPSSLSPASLPLSPPPLYPGNDRVLLNGGTRCAPGSQLDPVTRPIIEQLVLAADQFVVERRGGKSVMAGYPWFQDYSRDTFIALPGLAITCGRLDVARDIILTYAKFISSGMLPNRFPDTGRIPSHGDYNTADGTLWYFESVRAYYAASKDRALLRELFPSLCAVIDCHVRGTRFGIHQDPNDGLLRAGIDGLALTWMDAVCDGHAFTPRIGKPVELAALWFNALAVMATFASELGLEEDERRFAAMAAKSEKGFRRFWNEDTGYCYDVIDTGPDNNQVDESLRPNQLFAVSLQWSPLTSEQQAQVVAACSQSLLTSHSLRTLPKDSPGYRGVYDGNVVSRDAAYHCGTGWSWLMGPFVTAHLRAHGDRRAARSFLEPLLATLGSAGQGTLSEVYDGDPPFHPKGCIAQAWSVAEFLRVWIETEPDLVTGTG